MYNLALHMIICVGIYKLLMVISTYLIVTRLHCVYKQVFERTGLFKLQCMVAKYTLRSYMLFRYIGKASTYIFMAHYPHIIGFFS